MTVLGQKVTSTGRESDASACRSRSRDSGAPMA